jgi:pimeloyl-ACP methyl ester carboxylesterase/glutathione S-transferase
MKLYITPGSPYARMARIVVAEKGLEGRVETIVAKTRAADSPYYGINPSGRVPYLVTDDGTGLEESALICAYLDHLDGKPAFDVYGDGRLWEARRLEALARSLLDGLSVWGREILRPENERSPGVIQHETERARRLVDAWEREVAHPAMCGALNMIQITLACALGLEARNPGFLWRAGHPRLAAWFDLIAARPSFAETEPPRAAPAAPFFREAGAGPGVVCLHSNASSSGQWRGLMERLAPKFRVLAPDSYGAGKGPAWPAGRRVTLRDEVALVEPVLARAGETFALVGHSYGGAVALIAAISRPQRVRALALYEPTLFALVDAAARPPNDADGIRNTVADAGAALDAGNPEAAAERFIDFWMGKGAWARTPEARREPIVASVANVRGWKDALFDEPTPLSAFAALDLPVLYMAGKDSPASSLAVARLLTKTLPRVEVVEFEGLGHMGPVTHPDVVNEAIARFLERV